MTIRLLIQSDRASLKTILEETKVFSNEEIDVALELIDSVLNRPEQKDYIIYTGLDESAVVGYYCLGQTPMTDGTYDLYWIAVKPSIHNKGYGKKLLAHAESFVRDNSGRLIVAETSSQPKYQNTRKFYVKCEYTELARIKGYYKIGDDLVVYGKYVSQSGVQI
ncbi:MAG: GNAT family N-acetyltransferase [Ignavibacteriales bacterium]|nr:GNAT family N-acetyltransferase [Ignavibacteriales bacterium]